MRSQQERKYFFIKGFLLVLLGVAVSEMILSFLYNTWVYPFLRSHLAWEIFTVENTSGSAFYNILSLFGWFLLQGVLAVLPDYVSIPLRSFLERYAIQSIKIGINEYFSGYSSLLLLLYYFGCLIILLLLLFLLILPYGIGAWIYSRIINRELNLILEEENVQHIEFEKKRSRMLSDIAHDLKTPITTISGYAQALSDGIVSEEKKKQDYLNAISRKSVQMDELIQLLYEYVKLDSIEFTLKREKADIGEILRECVAAVYPDMEEKQMELCLDLPEKEVFYLVDRIEFSRAVMNLLNNALRHNPPGITVLIRFEKVKYSNNWKILIGDTGVKIAQEVASNIFDPFVMGDESRNSRGGSGLGMSIAHKILEMHGWCLTLEQKPTPEYTKAFIILLDVPEE